MKKKIIPTIVLVIILITSFIIINQEETSYGTFAQENYPEDTIYENTMEIEANNDMYISMAYVVNDQNQIKNILISLTNADGFDISKSNDETILEYNDDVKTIQQALLSGEDINYSQLNKLSENQVNSLIDGTNLPSDVTLAIND